MFSLIFTLCLSPWKELVFTHNIYNLNRRPTSSGILPPMVLFTSTISLIKLRLPMYGDKEPTKPLAWRSNTVTLLCLRPQVTPSHSQKWRESFQELKTFSGSRVICLEGQQSLMISLIPTEITGGGSTTSKNNKSFYMWQYNEQEKDVSKVNWTQ